MIWYLMLALNFSSYGKAAPGNSQARYKAYLTQALKYEHDGNLKEAREQFQKALLVRPKESAPRLHLGLIAIRQGVLAEAGHHLKTCLAVDAKDKECQRELASLKGGKSAKRNR